MRCEPFDKLKIDYLFRGVLFRFPASHPFENVVDFMIFDTPHSPSGYGVITVTGYCAGMIEILLPQESNFIHPDPNRPVKAISTKWLKSNWRKWVYDVTPSKVMVCVNGRAKPIMPRLV